MVQQLNEALALGLYSHGLSSHGLSSDGTAGILASKAIGTPTNVGYSLLLIAHVASAFLGFGAMCLTGFEASRARRGPGASSAAAVRRYFTPGINWAARTLYLVPVFGFALLADSGGASSTSDTFVVVGLLMWLAAAAAAEMVIWPAERRIQQAVSRDWRPDEALRLDCTRVVVAAWMLAVVFVAAVVVMVGKP
jgi:hypothetical protein